MEGTSCVACGDLPADLHQELGIERAGEITRPGAESAAAITAAQGRVAELQGEKEALRAQLAQRLLLREEAARTRRARNHWEREREALEAQVFRLQDKMHSARVEAEDTRLGSQERRGLLTDARERLAARREEALGGSLDPQLAELQERYREQAAAVAELRRALVRQLLRLFPTGRTGGFSMSSASLLPPESPRGSASEPVPTVVADQYAILGIPLELEQLRGADGEGYAAAPGTDTSLSSVSTGLGYVAHVVSSVAQYTGLPLPYDAKFGGSRSACVDHDGKEYELVAEGPGGLNSPDFRRALDMLNADIAFLSEAAGVPVQQGQEQCTLANVLRLTGAEGLGQEG